MIAYKTNVCVRGGGLRLLLASQSSYWRWYHVCIFHFSCYCYCLQTAEVGANKLVKLRLAPGKVRVHVYFCLCAVCM